MRHIANLSHCGWWLTHAIFKHYSKGLFWGCCSATPKVHKLQKYSAKLTSSSVVSHLERIKCRSMEHGTAKYVYLAGLVYMTNDQNWGYVLKHTKSHEKTIQRNFPLEHADQHNVSVSYKSLYTFDRISQVCRLIQGLFQSFGMILSIAIRHDKSIYDLCTHYFLSTAE